MIYVLAISITFIFAYSLKNEEMICAGVRRPTVMLGRKNCDKAFKVLCFLPLFLVSALRYNVGTDYMWTYYQGYIRVGNGNNFDEFSIGYKKMVQALNLITKDPQILFVVTSFIFCYFLWKAIYEQSADIFLSIVLVIVTRYYFISLNGIRQLIAMSIVIYATKYIIENKIIKFLIFLVIASLFHTSILLYAILIFLKKIDLSRKRIAIIGVGVIGVYFVGQSGVLIDIIKKVLSNTKYMAHLGHYGYIVGSKFEIFTLALNVLVLLTFYLTGIDGKKDVKFKFFLNIQIITVMICALMSIVPLMERVYWMFGFYQILSIPYVLRNTKNKKIVGSLVIGIYVIYSVYCIYDIILLQDHQVLPYTFFWNKTK